MDLDGSVNLVGPPFLCCKREDILVKQAAILRFRLTEVQQAPHTRANPAPISKLPASPSTSSLLFLHWVCLWLPRGHPLTTAKWVFMPFVCFSLPAFGYFHFKGNRFKMLGKVSKGVKTAQLIKSCVWLQKKRLLFRLGAGVKDKYKCERREEEVCGYVCIGEKVLMRAGPF